MPKPKYIEISERIKEGIESGVYQDLLPGVYKLAKDYNTTHITISKALRLLEEAGMVSVNGTRGTFVSSQKEFRKNRVIGIIGYNGHREELEAIEKVAAEHRYSVVALSPGDSMQKLLLETPEFLFKFPADGYIFSQSVLNEKLATVLRSNGIKFVSLNQVIKAQNISCIDFNLRENIEIILNKIRSFGHRKIAYIGITNDHNDYSKRMESYYNEYMEKEGIDSCGYFYTPGTHMEYYNKYGSDYYRQIALDALEWYLKCKEKPTALVVNEEPIAEIMTRNLLTMGVKIPKDLSVVCFSSNNNNSHFSKLYFDLAKRGEIAARLLLDQIKYQQCYVEQKLLTGDFIEGPSLKSPPDFIENYQKNKELAVV